VDFVEQQLLDFGDSFQGLFLVDEPEGDGFCVDQLKQTRLLCG
jgi:hypothetical protein